MLDAGDPRSSRPRKNSRKLNPHAHILEANSRISAGVCFSSLLESNLEKFSEGFRYACRQKRADQPKLPRPFRLEASDVGCLQTLGAAGNFEFNRLAFVQRLVTFRLNGRKVDENVLAGLALDEPKTLAGIKH